METIEGGSILSPAGFRAGAARGGIKTAPGEPDVALIVAERPAAAAGVFTTNRFASPTVGWNRAHLPADDLRAVVVNAGVANAATGARGARDVEATARLVAELVGCAPGQVCVASTGRIGVPLPMDRLETGIRQAHAGLATDAETARLAERAIMTTDTRPKCAAVRASLGGSAFHVGGMAKGSGMIAPNMATMLAFVTTDAAVEPAMLQNLLGEAVEQTFNRITVDGDSSTNDTVLALASGEAGARVDAGGRDAFADALRAVLAELALQIVRDGEGATRVARVQVGGAATDGDALAAARAIAESQLFKCALHGADPNWGRIVCALGYSGAQVDPARACVQIGEVRVFEAGAPTGADAAAHMARDEVAVRVELGLGEGRAAVWTCDLSGEYVRINAAYST